MRMRYSEIRQLFEQACEFPVEHETVVERYGEVELRTPTGDSVTVRDVLAVTDETTYRSPESLYTTLLGALDEAFVGRKYYDDRGGEQHGHRDVRGRTLSF